MTPPERLQDVTLAERLLAKSRAYSRLNGIDCAEMAELLAEAAAALSGEVDGWIAVADRLPEWIEQDVVFWRESVCVIAYCRDGVQRLAYVLQADDDDPPYWVMKGPDGLTLDDEMEPTHWQPLPEPPATPPSES